MSAFLKFILYPLLATAFLSIAGFAQSDTGSVSDFDGNVYKTVKIGDQWWMAENLRTTHFIDGTAIPYSAAAATVSADDYKQYYKFPNNDSTLVKTYGLLYSWSVICNQLATTMNDLCPDGWRIPDTADWGSLATFLGGKSIAGGKLKSASVAWGAANTASDSFGFKAMPAGDCNTAGFTQFGKQARFWTPQLVDAAGAGRTYILLSSASDSLTKASYRNINTLSLRCIKKPSTRIGRDQNQVRSLRTIACVTGNSILKIQNPPAGASVSVYSVNGRLAMKCTIGTERVFTCSVQHLSHGNYIVYIQSTVLTTSMKFVKE